MATYLKEVTSMLSFSAKITPLIPHDLILKTMTKRPDFILESVGELISKLDAEIQKQIIVVEVEGGSKGYAASSPKVFAELASIQAKAAEIGDKKYNEFLENKFTAKSKEFMSQIEILSRSFYDENDNGNLFVNFLLQSGYSAKETCEVFAQFTKYAAAERKKYSPENSQSRNLA